MKILNSLSADDFLTNYWQKKPLLIKKAMPDFVNLISGDELAGLAMEKEIESRLVLQKPNWQLRRGPFKAKDFRTLPTTHWTLLVQGVDRFIPEVYQLLDQFNFIPQWRVDDVMISYAVKEGGVGPHYDDYDVFLLQAQGQRKWSLTTKNCNPDNYIPGLGLRIMREFSTEVDYTLDQGDMLYLPPHVGHNGIASSDDCMTYSFGYRSYRSSELWSSFGDYLLQHDSSQALYQDPDWKSDQGINSISPQAIVQVKNALKAIINDEDELTRWFASFVTSLDQQAELLLPEEEETLPFATFASQLAQVKGFQRNPLCRFAYYHSPQFVLFVNGMPWPLEKVECKFAQFIADNRFFNKEDISKFMQVQANIKFLYQLFCKNFLELS